MKTRTQSRKEYLERVKQARLLSGKKQDEVARAIGVDRPTYTNYESRRAMPQKYIVDFCLFTGVTEKWLLTGEGPMKAGTDDTEEERLILERIRQLRDKEREMMESYLELLENQKGEK